MRAAHRQLDEAILPREGQEHLRHALTEAGCRFTRQRAAVYSYLTSVHTHPTAEEVFNAVRPVVPSISLATVYKSLEALVACRLALKLQLGEGPARYDCRTDNHFHLHDERTGEVRDLPLSRDPQLLARLVPELSDELAKQGFRLRDYRLELLGAFDKPA